MKLKVLLVYQDIPDAVCQSRSMQQRVSRDYDVELKDGILRRDKHTITFPEGELVVENDYYQARVLDLADAYRTTAGVQVDGVRFLNGNYDTKTLNYLMARIRRPT